MKCCKISIAYTETGNKIKTSLLINLYDSPYRINFNDNGRVFAATFALAEREEDEGAEEEEETEEIENENDVNDDGERETGVHR